MGGEGAWQRQLGLIQQMIVLLFNFHHVAEEIVRANEPI